jgi:hypothetical protein
MVNYQIQSSTCFFAGAEATLGVHCCESSTLDSRHLGWWWFQAAFRSYLEFSISTLSFQWIISKPNDVYAFICLDFVAKLRVLVSF